MTESCVQTNRAYSLPTLRPLQIEGRYREPEVEAQITLLSHCAAAEFWLRVRQRDPHAADYVQPEALVYLLREKVRSGDSDTAWKIAELLIERNTRYVTQLVQGWKRLSESQKEECIYDVQARMLQDLFNLSRGCEFWEVRFWLCLRRRVTNIVQKYLTVADAEFNPEPLEDGEGNTRSFMENVAAPDRMPAEMQVQLREALALLTEQERTAFVLYHYEDWAQEQIAQHLGVVDRTVRNLLTRAERKLATWRKDN